MSLVYFAGLVGSDLGFAARAQACLAQRNVGYEPCIDNASKAPRDPFYLSSLLLIPLCYEVALVGKRMLCYTSDLNMCLDTVMLKPIYAFRLPATSSLDMTPQPPLKSEKFQIRQDVYTTCALSIFALLCICDL